MNNKKLIYIWGVPVIDWLNITDHEESSGLEFYRKLSNPQRRMHVTPHLGGGVLIEKLLVHLVPLENVAIDSNVRPAGYAHTHTSLSDSVTTRESQK